MLKTYTTSDELLAVLNVLMKLPSLANFRLVGGTALSLLLGHRKSDDIDLFTDQDYGTIDFKKIELEIKELFPYFRNDDNILGLNAWDNNFGLHLHVGQNEASAIKADVLNWSTANFIYPVLVIDGIRLATIEEIALMKLDTISRGGRKKDFWDMSEIFEQFTFTDLLNLYSVKYPFNNKKDVRAGMINFEIADNMPDPICLKGKYWEIIKDEMSTVVRGDLPG